MIALVSMFVLTLMSSLLAQGHVFVKTAPSGPSVSTTSGNFVDVPDMTLWFFQYFPSHVCITFSAECYSDAGKRMFLRAVVDGQPAEPSDVLFCVGDFSGTRSFSFKSSAGGGLHQVSIQYAVDGGGTAYLGDRSMWVATAPEVINIVAAPSGPDVSTTNTSFENIPDAPTQIFLPSAGDVVVTLSGEAETSNSKRMFARVLVDGQSASPSDVVFKAGSFTGTNAFTFVLKNVTAGSHSLSIQWKVDGGGTAYLGDRTFIIAIGESTGLLGDRGGVVSASAPSGPQISTTSGGFTEIQDMATSVDVSPNSSLVIGFTAEAYSTVGKRIFVRALLDGYPATPSDVVFNTGDFSGVYSFNFTLTNVATGSHSVNLQWHVDGGGTAFLGDRNLTVTAFTAPCPDMTNHFNAIKTRSGDQPLLVICWDPHRPAHPAPALSDVQNLIFGATNSVRDYFLVNSHNRFAVNNVGMKGWYDADKAADHYWAADDPTDKDGDGWTSGHVEKWAEAIHKADKTFNFAQYDLDHDGYVSKYELGVLIVIPQNSPFGTNRIAVGQQYPNSIPLTVDGVTITWIAEAYIGAPPNLGLVAHELCHLFLDLPDMYFNFFQPYAAGMYSIMDVGYYDNHIDPFHKIRLGWMQPALVHSNGYIPIDAVELSHVAYILYDPPRGNREYFIIENRQPGLAYDSSLPDAGLGIWHIMENPDVYENLPTPVGVPASDWATIGAGDYGRRSVRMLRPVYGPPFNNNTALWDGSDPLTGYNLLSDDPDPNHVSLKWFDGTPSGFAVKDISASGANMQAYIEVPWQPTDVRPGTQSPLVKANQFRVEQNYPNPFNPETVLPFYLNVKSRVTITIFNMLGQQVVTLLNQDLAPGNHTVKWHGVDANGLPVSAGMYLYQIRTAKELVVKKMVLTK